MIEKQSQQRFRQKNGLGNKFATFVSSIPYKNIARIGRVLGTLLCLIDIPHRRIVGRNLKFIYPEMTNHQIKKKSKSIFQNLGITVIEICQMIFFSEDKIKELIRSHFDLSPKEMIRGLRLQRPIYKNTACYGHFGRDEEGFTWELLDKAEALKSDDGL